MLTFKYRVLTSHRNSLCAAAAHSRCRVLRIDARPRGVRMHTVIKELVLRRPPEVLRLSRAYRRLQQKDFREEEAWEEKLSGYQIRGWRALNQGVERIVCSQIAAQRLA